MTCCAVCKGAVPWFICRDRSCFCHIEQDAIARKKPSRVLHRDPTAWAAIALTNNRRTR